MKASHWVIIVAIVATAAMGAVYMLTQSNERIARGVATTAAKQLKLDSDKAANESLQQNMDILRGK